MDIYKRIYELENEIASLPQGSINMKKIYGKEQPYRKGQRMEKAKASTLKRTNAKKFLQVLKGANSFKKN